MKVDTDDIFNFQDSSLRICVFLVAFNPIFWNIVSRLEHYTHFLTKMTKSPLSACYIFATTIFTLGLLRNYYFEESLHKQETSPFLDNILAKATGYLSLIFGQVLVLSSMYRLGVIGTYSGDYFGILMKDRVTKFPFNICSNPMYRGSTLSFLGYALIQAKAAGLVISLLVHLVYEIILKFEEPFTANIYAERKKKMETTN